MNELIKLTRKIKNKYDTIYQITKANEGHPDYVKNYRDADRRNRRLKQVEEELKALKAERTAMGYQTIRKVKGKVNKNPNRFYDSFGNSYTQREIDRKRGEAYKEKYEGNPHPRCEESGLRAQCSSHIISQVRCKNIGKTELIWNEANFYPATHEANSRWESNDKTLKHYTRYLEFMRIHDFEGYNKRL